MRILLLSIFLITLMGMIFIPNAFGTTQIVWIPYGSSNGNNYDLSQIDIQKGDIVKWANLDKNAAHTVTSTSTNWTVDSGDLLPNNDENYCYPNCKPSFSYTFDVSGTYNYECKIHSWMKGVVKVIEFGQDAEIKIHGYAGDMYIDKSQYEVTKDKSVVIKIYGKVKNPNIGDKPLLTVTKPDGSIKLYDGVLKRDGSLEWQSQFPVNYEDRGTYNVVSTFGLENIGTANFVVVERPNPTIENPFPPSDDESTSVIGSSQNNQENVLTVTTDFQSYKKGDMIKISGTVPYLGPSDPNNASHVTFVITDPRNNIITVSQISPNDNRMYRASINGDGPLWKLEGDYTVKANFVNENVDTVFFFSLAGAPPEQVYGYSSDTILKLDSLDNIFKAQGPDSRSSINFSGQLIEEGPVNLGFNYGISGATITLEFTGFMMDGNNYHKITTDNTGRFDFGVTMPVGEGYAVQAVFDGWYEFDRYNDGDVTDLLSSRSQIEYFEVKLSSQSQSPPIQSEGRSLLLDGFLVIILIVIIGTAIAIKKRKKKPLVTIPPPSGRGTAGTAAIAKAFISRKIPRTGKAPLLMGKIRQAKRVVGKQSPKVKKKKDVMHYFRCRKCHLEEFLENEADGQQYCTKCGWKKW